MRVTPTAGVESLSITTELMTGTLVGVAESVAVPGDVDGETEGVAVGGVLSVTEGVAVGGVLSVTEGVSDSGGVSSTVGVEDDSGSVDSVDSDVDSLVGEGDGVGVSA